MTTEAGAVPPATGAADLVEDDARLAVRASGGLAELNRAGVLTAADIHVAQRLGRLGGEGDERVLLAVALAVRGVRQGSVCVDLAAAPAIAAADDAGTEGPDEGAAGWRWPDADAWQAALRASRIVADGTDDTDGPDDRPVRLVDGRVYLDRYWRDEHAVRLAVDARTGEPAGTLDDAALREALARLFPREEDDRQRLAAAVAAVSRFTVVTGGPGTGKTTTVARLVAVLQAAAGPGLRVALAAPTGKASARLQEAANEAVAQVRALSSADADRVGRLTATTVHRLLGWRPGTSTRFRHDRARRLPHDVVVVDESSMVSLPLMARLLEALRPQARLVLVGDPDQLASVEAGAVLGDLVHRPATTDELPRRLGDLVPADLPPAARDALRNGVVRLERPHRYGGDLHALAGAIQRADAGAVLEALESSAVTFVATAGDRPSPDEVAGLRADVAGTGAAVVAAASVGDAQAALDAVDRHRLLLAHRRGPAGVAHWSRQAQEWVEEAAGHRPGVWPVGLPLLVARNDRTTGLYNGDVGVVVAVEDGVAVAFRGPDGPRLVRPHRLPAVEPVHAMTVHRAQGSQFARVGVVLPPPSSPLLTRELLYTAVTRAQEHVLLVGTREAVLAAVARPVQRASGLRAPR